MTTQQDLNYYMPTRLIYGAGKFHELGTIAAKYGKRALLVTYQDQSLKTYVDQAIEMLNDAQIDVVLFDRVEANPTHLLVDLGGELARREKCDLVIGLGGGSAMDTAKTISVVAVEETGIWDIVEGAEITTSPLPLIVIPTTAGTGSEVTQYAVISNREKHRKEGFAKTEFYPREAILDPELTVNLPAPITAATGMDALTHAIEAYTTRFANLITDMYATKAIELCATYLRRAVFDGQDMEARGNMLLANTFAGIAITHADTSLAHVIGEAVGAVYNSGHGLSVALTLPAVMEFNCASNLEKFANIQRLMEGNNPSLTLREAASLAPQAVRNLIIDTGLPLGLGALGIEENDEVLALCTRPGWDAANMRPASKSDFELLIRGSISGDMSFWKQGGH